jgi:hypothetical protein
MFVPKKSSNLRRPILRAQKGINSFQAEESVIKNEEKEKVAKKAPKNKKEENIDSNGDE